MLADTNNYDFQNAKWQQLLPGCDISSKSPSFAKRVVMNLSDILKWSFCLQQLSLATGMWFDWLLRHNAFR